MYKIIGADGREYGPVSAESLRQWIAENRLNAQSQIQADDMSEWKPLGSFPEFAAVLAAQASGPAPIAPSPTAHRAFGAADFAGRDYSLEIFECLSRGWELFKNHVGLLLGTVLIYAAIELVIGVLGIIPCIGPLFSILNMVIAGPLIGGLYYVFLQASRQQPTSAGEVFIGFRTAFGQLLLGQLVPAFFSGLCIIPAVVVGLVVLLPTMMRNQDPEAVQIVIVAIVAFVCMLPAVFLQINWMFTLPLIIDRRLQFWPAMGVSWRMVTKHWWRVFGLTLVVGLVNLLGLACFCVGALLTGPVVLGALVAAYETMFQPAAAPSA